MLEPSLVRDVLDAALATGGDFAELFMEDRRDTSLVLQLNRLETVNSGRIHGAGVRVYVGLKPSMPIPTTPAGRGLWLAPGRRPQPCAGRQTSASPARS